MLQIERDAVDALGFDLAAAVASFAVEVGAHKLTEGIPAPTAHPVVESIVRVHDGEFSVIEPPEPEPEPEPEPLPPFKRQVLKSVIVSRLIETGKIGAAYQALNSNPEYWARWVASDRPAINYDDPDALALLRAIGADPEVILAP